METHSKSDLWQLVIAFVGSICVAIGWFMANLYPDQVPQSLAELFAAVVTMLVIGLNILLFVALGTALRRRHPPLPPPASASVDKQFGVAERLLQIYLNIHGSVWVVVVAVVAMICVTTLAFHSIDAATASGTAAADSARNSGSASQAGGTVDPVQLAGEVQFVYQAEGYGRARAEAKTSEERRRTAIQAAEIDAAAKLLEQIIGSVIERITTMEDGQIDKDHVERVVRGWLPTRAETLGETFDATTGEATVTAQLELSEALLEEVYKRVTATQ